MNYGEVRDQFISILNRRDVTPSLVDNFLKLSIQRAQRLLRVPAAENVYILDVGDDYQHVDIPGDYLKLVSITIDDTELRRVSLTEALRYSKVTGCPQVFSRNNSNWIIGPRPDKGAQVVVVYHADFSALSAPTDSSWLTEIAPDIIINGALSFACKYFVDPRGSGFDDDFIKGIADLNLQASDDELTNSAMSPASYYPEDYC